MDRSHSSLFTAHRLPFTVYDFYDFYDLYALTNSLIL